MGSQTRLPFSESPLSGKQRFKLRTLNNFVFAIVVFVPFALLTAYFSSPRFWIAWLSDAAFIAILYYFFRVFWDKRPIWIRCPTCEKRIATNTPWKCGACEAKNEHVDDFPFIHRCEACGVEPKAYQCHHKECGKLIFLTNDESVRNYAYCVNPITEARDVEIEHTEFGLKQRRGKYRLELALLYKEVEEAENKLGSVEPKTQTPEEKVEEHRAKRRAKTITATEIYRRERKVNEEKYKDDPEMLKLVNEDLEDWYKSGDWERIV